MGDLMEPQAAAEATLLPFHIGLLALLLLPIVIWREAIWNGIKTLKPRIKPLPAGLRMQDWVVWLSTWFGSGRLRPMPGTMGSLAAIPLGYYICAQGGPFLLATAALALFLVGTVAADRFGKKSGVADDQSIVVDEVVGMWIAAIPAENSWLMWMIAFFLFRLFDVYKPWPASYYDNRSRNGYDTMMDDVVAGIYALPGVAAIALFIVKV